MITTRRKAHIASEGQDAGFALVVVLLFLTLLTAVTTPFVLAARSHFLSSNNYIDDAFMHQSLSDMLDIGASLHGLAIVNEVHWNSATLSCTVELDRDQKLHVEFINHAGLIDLNSANADLLQLGFSALGLGETQSKSVANSVVANRQYQRGDQTIQPEVVPIGGFKHLPFEHVAELYDFEILRSTSTAALFQTFTIHARSGTVDALRMPSGLKEAAGQASEEARSSIVESGSRHPALAVRITMTRGGDFIMSASRDFAIDEASAHHKPLNAVRYDYAPVGAPSAENDSSVCPTYFAPATISLFEELVA